MHHIEQPLSAQPGGVVTSPEYRKCANCGVEKPLAQFSPSKSCTGGRRPCCNTCQNLVTLASGRARLRLVKSHPDEFTQLIAEERAKLGLPPSRRANRVRSAST
jgi:hypothetical protein